MQFGFGPKILSKQGKETKYTLRLIPLGGFVNMLGETERSEEEGAFNKASIFKRISIVISGGLVNIVFGILVYFILVSSTGGYISKTVDTIVTGYAAETANFQKGDEIIKVNGEKIRIKSNLDEKINASKGDEVVVTIKRAQEIIDIKIKPTEQLGYYYLGILFEKADNTFSNNIYYGFWDTVDFSASIIDNLKLLFTGHVKADQLVGPVGISEIVSKTNGIVEFIYMLALISLSLGVTNLMPFPPLDRREDSFIVN